MNPIESAIKYTRARIDRRLLTDALLDEDDRRLRGTLNIESALQEKVISEFVVPDLSTKGGKVFDVDLTGMGYEMIDQWTRVYTIPPEHREGRDIVRAEYVARSIYAGSTTVVPNYFNQYGAQTGIARDVQKMHLANSPVQQTMSAEIEFIGPNVLELRDFDLLHISPVLKCKLALSPNLEEITPPYQSELNKLVYFAVARFVYNTLRLEVDLGKLESGREFGEYARALEELADTPTMYDEELEKWTKYLILIDRRSAQSVYRRSGH